MSALLERLASAEPAIWLETAPPRGIAVDSLLKRLEAAADSIDAINLVDNALGRVKMSGLVFAAMLKARTGIAIALNFSCRDRNRFALKSDLLGAAALGIDGVVALRGDKLADDAAMGAKQVHDLDPFSLLQMIADLNRGDTGEGRKLLKTLPRLVPGVVGNPNRKALDRELELLDRKAAAGARFVVTQPVFAPEAAHRFLRHAQRAGLHVVLGVLPIKRPSMAQYLKRQIDDLREAHHHFDRYEGMSEEAARRASIEQNIALMRELAGEVAGFNIMSGGGPSLAIELALEWRRHRRSASPARGE
jgi:methylenetetrahydrofolate reductase (NADPH)